MKTLTEKIISKIVDADLEVTEYNQVLSDGSIILSHNKKKYIVSIDFDLDTRKLELSIYEDINGLDEIKPETDLLVWLYEYLENKVESYNEDERLSRASAIEDLDHQWHHFGFGK